MILNQLKILDSRRITGPSLFTDKSGAMLDVAVSTMASSELISNWEQSARHFLTELGWGSEITQFRSYDGGVSLFMSAPIDALYSACEVNEASLNCSLPKSKLSISSEIKRLRELIIAESDSSIIELELAANEHGVKFLQSDEIVSIGSGTGAISFEVDQIPAPAAIDWDSVHDIPTLLVTGTNGKSTTVRLTESILFEANINVGASSTDGIRVGGESVEAGDYSGPEGARNTVRNQNVETAVLEVARGGMLRRGLPLGNVDAAVITNIAEDHFGDYGVNSIAEMAATKFIVRKGLANTGILILNADDEAIVDYSTKTSNPICWFSLEAKNPRLTKHIKNGGMAAFLDGDELIYVEDNHYLSLLNVHEIPITMAGMARYNISNCLGAICLAKSINIDDEFIISGLKSFTSSFESNPGRANFYDKNGVFILVDFAHNPHGMRAVLELANGVRANRKLVLMSQAGDRSNADIQNLVESTMGFNPDRVHVAEMSDNYLRGRKPGEVSQVLKNAFLKLGLLDNAIASYSDIPSGVKGALSWGQKGDLLLLFVLDRMSDVKQLIDEYDETIS